MKSIWMGIAPGLTTTGVVVMAGPSETILKAQLSRIQSILVRWGRYSKALALWQGQPVRAALCADAAGFSSDSNLGREAFLDDAGHFPISFGSPPALTANAAIACTDSATFKTASGSYSRRWRDDLR
jgi:hypothetical protein